MERDVDVSVKENWVHDYEDIETLVENLEEYWEEIELEEARSVPLKKFKEKRIP